MSLTDEVIWKECRWSSLQVKVENNAFILSASFLSREVAQMDKDQNTQTFDKSVIRDSHDDTQSNFQKAKGTFDLV